MSDDISDVKQYMQILGHDARRASRALASASTAQKNQALEAMADDLDAQRELLMQEKVHVD